MGVRRSRDTATYRSVVCDQPSVRQPTCLGRGRGLCNQRVQFISGIILRGWVIRPICVFRGPLPLASRACVVDEMTEPDPSKLELWLERDYIAKRGHNSLSITVDAVEFRAEMNAYVASQSRAWAKKKVSSAWLKLI